MKHYLQAPLKILVLAFVSISCIVLSYYFGIISYLIAPYCFLTPTYSTRYRAGILLVIVNIVMLVCIIRKPHIRIADIILWSIILNNGIFSVFSLIYYIRII